MSRLIAMGAMLALLTGCMGEFGQGGAPSASMGPRVIQSFDPDWRFAKGDAPGADRAAFDDAAWRKVDVPHDWAIEGPFEANVPGGRGNGYAPSGVSWYRKSFTLPADYADKHVFIDFDGVMNNSEVWINGTSLGKRPYGYSSFQYEMTGHLNFGPGKTNVLAVRTDNSKQPDTRFYEGAGVYRHVRLEAVDAVHVDHWGTFVSTPQANADAATVHVQNTIINQSDKPQDVIVRTLLLDPSGKTVQSADAPAQSIAPGKTLDFVQDINVAKPMLWNPDGPNMYQAVAQVMVGGKTVDDQAASFGIRQIEFKTDSGFWINGKNMKLLGVCLHSDGGAFGMAVPTGVWEHRLRELRAIGVNAIRCAHNPPAPDFLDTCDRMGFLVMDEDFDCWTVGKNANDYHIYFDEWHMRDLRDMVMRDRNHPSIVLYSAGNEIHDTPKEELAKSLLKPMVDEFHKYDPTRPVTQALFRPNVSHDYTNGLADMLDVIGTNYRDSELIQAWKDKPGRKIVGTEQQHGADTWVWLRDNPQHSGQFIWAGIDYLGESGWPSISSGSGVLDRTGALKTTNGFQREAWWSTKPVVEIARSGLPGDFAGGGRGAFGRGRRGGGAPAGAAPGADGAAPPAGGGAPAGRGGGALSNWTMRPPATQPGGNTTVTVYSNCDEVELFLNDKSLGSKPKNQNALPQTWQVAYESGVLRAVGKNAGKAVANDELKTAGAPAKIVLATDGDSVPNNWDGVCFVTAKIVDDKGVICPFDDDMVAFTVSGPGIIARVDNGLGSSSESFMSPQRHANEGHVVAMIKASAPSGQITITASAQGIANGSATIKATPGK